MGDTWFVFLPFAVFFGVLIGHSSKPRTCPSCGVALAPARPDRPASQRWAMLGAALGAACLMAMVFFVVARMK